MFHLRGQIAATAAQNHPRRGREQSTIGVAHAVRAQEIHTARAVVPGRPSWLLHKGREGTLGFVQVLGRMLVEDNHIRA